MQLALYRPRPPRSAVSSRRETMYRTTFGTWIAVGLLLGGATGCALDSGDIGGAQGALAGGICSAWGGTYSNVTFTDEQATNAIDLADHGSSEELGALFGVGPAIASHIENARPFALETDPLAALDAVAWVGESVLTSFRDQSLASWCMLRDGRQSCCVDVACEGLGGVSTIPFTDEQAHVVLDWANHATDAQLQEVCHVGPTVAARIAAARPLTTIAELDAIPLIGSHALYAFTDHPLFACATKGSVADEWCDEPGASCVCEGAPPAPPPELTSETFYWLSDVDPALASVISGELTTRAYAMRDTSFPDGVTFSDVTIHSEDGVPVRYEVDFVQWLDREGGIQLHIRFTLDASYDETDAFVFI
jgi:DNA uptake protein ComE-like DNA-binding protein